MISTLEVIETAEWVIDHYHIEEDMLQHDVYVEALRFQEDRIALEKCRNCPPDTCHNCIEYSIACGTHLNMNEGKTRLKPHNLIIMCMQNTDH